MTKKMLLLFGQTVRNFRKQKGYSQEAFADLCHLHRTYIGGIERGERNVGLLNLLLISKALNVLPGKLFQKFDQSIMSNFSINLDKNV